MENRITVHKGYYDFNIEAVEKKYSAKYMGDFSIKDKYGNWSDKPVSIFYVENPDTGRGHSHYFGLFTRFNDPDNFDDFDVIITRGDSAFEAPLTGIAADDGEVIVSCFPHDYVESRDKSVMLDGGRSGYLRYRGSKEKLVNIIVNKDKLEIEK